MSNDNIIITALLKEDLQKPILQDLAVFLENGFYPDSKERWLKRFRFWWDANPFLQDNESLGWILYNQENESIEGFFGKIPVLFQHKESQYKAIASTSWYVSDEFRGRYSTSLYLQYLREKDISIYLNTTPITSIQKNLTKMGFNKVGGDDIENHMMIISLKKFLMFAGTLCGKFSESETGFKKSLLTTLSKVGLFGGKIIPDIKKSSDVKPYLYSDTYRLQIIHDCSKFQEHLQVHTISDSIVLSKDEKSLHWLLFSSEVASLLQRVVCQIFTQDGDYCGYIIYDIQPVGVEQTLRVRELQLLKYEIGIVKFLLTHLKYEAKRRSCAAVYIGLQGNCKEIDTMLHKLMILSLKTENRYFVKFRKNVIPEVNPYDIFVPSDLDPDVGFL